MIQRFSNAALTLAVALTTVAGSAVAQQTAVPTATAVATPKAQPVAKATTLAKSSTDRSSVPKAVPQARPLVVTVDLHSSTKISGTLTDATTLEMQTSFGSADMPLSEVAGIRFATADDPTTTVVMHNGDSITGATDVKLVTVETEWGVASINGQSVQSILFVPDVTWNPLSGLNGKRWSLTSVKKEAPKPPAAATPQPTTTNRGVTTSYPSRYRSR